MTRDSSGMLSRKGQVWACPYRWGCTLIAYRKGALLRCAISLNLCILGRCRCLSASNTSLHEVGCRWQQDWMRLPTLRAEVLAGLTPFAHDRKGHF